MKTTQNNSSCNEESSPYQNSNVFLLARNSQMPANRNGAENYHTFRVRELPASNLGTPRIASVVAEQNSIVYSLSLSDLEQMQASDPEVANLFHRLRVVLLSQRVGHITEQALERS